MSCKHKVEDCEALAWELRRVLPTTDPETGDRLTVTDDLGSIQAAMVELGGKMNMTAARWWKQGWFFAGLTADDDKYAALLDILQREDYAAILRYRNEQLHALSVFNRPNDMEAVIMLYVGGVVPNARTVKRALYDVGIRVLRATKVLPADPTGAAAQSRGWKITTNQPDFIDQEMRWTARP